MPLTQKEIEQKVIQILSDRLNIDAQKIKPDSKLVEDLGMDSFGAVEVMFELEERFGIDVPDQDMVDVKTVQEIIEYIHRQLNKNKINK